MRMQTPRTKLKPQVVVTLSEAKIRADKAEEARKIAAAHHEQAMIQGLAEASRQTRRLLGIPSNS